MKWCYHGCLSLARSFVHSAERRVCTRKNERQGGRQRAERQIGPREGEEGGYQNEISQANKYSVIAGNRVIARYGAERRGFTGCGPPIHPRPVPHVRAVHTRFRIRIRLLDVPPCVIRTCVSSAPRVPYRVHTSK